MEFLENGVLKVEGPQCFSLELSPWQKIASIPEHERNTFERDFASAVEITKECEHMPCDTLEQAAELGRRVLYTEWLTSGRLTHPPFMHHKLWEAARHVEHLTAMHYIWLDSASRKEISSEEATRRLRAGQFNSTPAAVTLANAGSAVYDTMSCDEFVLALCATWCSRFCLHWVSSFNLASHLYSSPAVQRRIRTVLLPQLAARDVGEAVHMDVAQWEAVWIGHLVFFLVEGIRAQPPTSAVVAQARRTLQAAAQRLLEVEPKRVHSHLVAMEVVAELGQLDAAYRTACSMGRLGSEQGNDVAVAIGNWTRASYILLGALGPGVATYRLGKIRAMAERAVVAGKRLKRWYMTPAVDGKVGKDMAFVRRTLADLQHLPDSAKIRLPHVTSAAMAARNAAASKGRPGSADTTGTSAAPSSSAAGAGAPSASAASGRQPSSAATPAAAPAPDAAGPKCDGCGCEFLKYQYCGGCRQRRYCGRDCQAADWRAGHKSRCRELAEAAKAAGAGAGTGEEDDE